VRNLGVRSSRSSRIFLLCSAAIGLCIRFLLPWRACQLPSRCADPGNPCSYVRPTGCLPPVASAKKGVRIPLDQRTSPARSRSLTSRNGTLRLIATVKRETLCLATRTPKRRVASALSVAPATACERRLSMSALKVPRRTVTKILISQVLSMRRSKSLLNRA
jgi:hypothetical protein